MELDTTLYVSPWPQIERWNRDIVTAQQDVYRDVGVWVPSDTIKSVMQIETGGVWPAPTSPHGYVGLMQVGPGSWGDYDLGRVQTDPGYSIYAGTSDLALRARDSGFMPWENVIVGYFSGHYVPNGASDGFNTDYQYQEQYLNNVDAMRPGGDVGLPAPGAPGGDLAAAAGNWGLRIGVFVLAAVLLGAGLYALKRGGD